MGPAVVLHSITSRAQRATQPLGPVTSSGLLVSSPGPSRDYSHLWAPDYNPGRDPNF